MNGAKNPVWQLYGEACRVKVVRPVFPSASTLTRPASPGIRI
jgi:hypothetical protein